MKSFSQTFLSVLVLFGFSLSLAQSNSASAPMNKLETVVQQVKIADPQIITDKKLQADEGALSRYSMKVGLSYAGPGIGDLGNKDRPNPDNVSTTNQTKMSSTIGARYRLNGVSTVSLGTGVSAVHPLHGWDRTDVNDPYLSYDRSARWNNLQLRNIFTTSGVSTPEYKRVGEVATFSYELDTVHNIGDSRFAAGFDSKFEYYLYNRGYKSSDRKASQSYMTFYPNLKYEISDKVNVNTSLSLALYNPRKLHDRYAFWNRPMTERLGIGYSYRRDVYLSPYITFYPKKLRPITTTFNLSATFSL
jgi:hypothetical protein